jgi:hypothetical protein
MGCEEMALDNPQRPFERSGTSRNVILRPHCQTVLSWNQIERLLAYNTVLAKRTFRTHVVEEWEVPNIEVPRSAVKSYHPPQSLLRGLTLDEKLEGERFISLGSYFGQKKTKKLADALRSRRKNVGHVLKRYAWRESCVRDATEGMFYTWARDVLQELQERGLEAGRD